VRARSVSARRLRQRARARYARALARARAPHRLKAHYDETQCNSEQALLAHLPALRALLASRVDVESLQAQIRTAADPARKRALWAELKLASITRTLCATYALALAHLLMRLATNLLSRHLMLEHALLTSASTAAEADKPRAARAQPGSAASEIGAGLPVATQLRLLAAADHLLKGAGLDRLLAAVAAAVRERCDPLPLTTPLDGRAVSDLLARLREDVERAPGAHARLIGCMLPPADAAELALGALRADGADDDGGGVGRGQNGGAERWLDAQLVAEVRAAVGSAPFAVVLEQTLDACFAELRAELAERAGQPDAAREAALPLAKLVPRIDSCVLSVLAAPTVVASGEAPFNRYVRAACRAPSLDEFCFMVYAPNPTAESACWFDTAPPDAERGGGGEHACAVASDDRAQAARSVQSLAQPWRHAGGAQLAGSLEPFVDAHATHESYEAFAAQ
jgi:hypothetical protein